MLKAVEGLPDGPVAKIPCSQHKGPKVPRHADTATREKPLLAITREKLTQERRPRTAKNKEIHK